MPGPNVPGPMCQAQMCEAQMCQAQMCQAQVCQAQRFQAQMCLAQMAKTPIRRLIPPIILLLKEFFRFVSLFSQSACSGDRFRTLCEEQAVNVWRGEER